MINIKEFIYDFLDIPRIPNQKEIEVQERINEITMMSRKKQKKEFKKLNKKYGYFCEIIISEKEMKEFKKEREEKNKWMDIKNELGIRNIIADNEKDKYARIIFDEVDFAFGDAKFVEGELIHYDKVIKNGIVYVR